PARGPARLGPLPPPAAPGRPRGARPDPRGPPRQLGGGRPREVPGVPLARR
ncbi:unnamed protein product, partial [Heterosigma akashiwo]